MRRAYHKSRSLNQSARDEPIAEQDARENYLYQGVVVLVRAEKIKLIL